MVLKRRISVFFRGIFNYIILIISMAGFVPRHASAFRIIAITFVIALSLYINLFEEDNTIFGVIYFSVCEFLYLGFIFLVLSANGFRHWFIKKWKNEEQGYVAYETVLGILFFLNMASLGFIASSTHGNLFESIDKELLFIIAGFMSLAGFIVKIWSAKVVSIDIYYWKDMFLGKKISEFAESGPYKYLSNPMYGMGQLQAYAFAIWYGSLTGIIAAFINQILIFAFYFTVEKKFIKRVYQGNDL